MCEKHTDWLPPEHGSAPGLNLHRRSAPWTGNQTCDPSVCRPMLWPLSDRPGLELHFFSIFK